MAEKPKRKKKKASPIRARKITPKKSTRPKTSPTTGRVYVKGKPISSIKKNVTDKKTVNKKVKAAKKLIRKGKNQKGMATVRAKVQDEVGRQHKYDINNPVVKKLDSSRLVQRKYKQERKSLAKAQVGKRAYKDWVGKPKSYLKSKASETYTKKEAKDELKKIRKSYKADAKKTTKVAKARAKTVRKSIRKR